MELSFLKQKESVKPKLRPDQERFHLLSQRVRALDGRNPYLNEFMDDCLKQIDRLPEGNPVYEVCADSLKKIAQEHTGVMDSVRSPEEKS